MQQTIRHAPQVAVLIRLKAALKIPVSAVQFRPRPPYKTRACEKRQVLFIWRRSSGARSVPVWKKIASYRSSGQATGARQRSCRLSHAATGCLSAAPKCVLMMESRWVLPRFSGHFHQDVMTQ